MKLKRIIKESFKNTYYLPDTLATRKGIKELADNGYKIGVVSLEKLVKDNNLLDDNDLMSYHKRIWDNKKANEYSIDDTKALNWRAWEIPNAVKYNDGRIILNDGRHRCRALYNQGYDSIEIMVTDQKNKNQYQLVEDIEIHDTLNPLIWDSEDNLLPEVENKIEDIVDTFIEILKEDEIEIKLDDIYLLGSNANYNYNEASDLDIHLIVDETFDCEENHLPIIYQAYKTLFNRKYDITFKGINVELYVENKDDLSNVSTGLYSLNDGWIKKPDKNKLPQIDNEEVNRQVIKWANKYNNLKSMLTIDNIDDYINDLYELRTNSIKTDGEFGIGNLVFKEIRRVGILDELKEKKTELESKELSIVEKLDSKLYHYDGPVFGYNDNVLKTESDEYVQAVSEKQALNRISYVLKSKLGFDPKKSIIHLEPACLSEVNQDSYKDIKYCPECNKRLTDGGECPYCNEYPDIRDSDEE